MTFEAYLEQLRSLLKDIDTLRVTEEVPPFPSGKVRTREALNRWFLQVLDSIQEHNDYHDVRIVWSRIGSFREQTAGLEDDIVREACEVLCVEGVLEA